MGDINKKWLFPEPDETLDVYDRLQIAIACGFDEWARGKNISTYKDSELYDLTWNRAMKVVESMRKNKRPLHEPEKFVPRFLGWRLNDALKTLAKKRRCYEVVEYYSSLTTNLSR